MIQGEVSIVVPFPKFYKVTEEVFQECTGQNVREQEKSRELAILEGRF